MNIDERSKQDFLVYANSVIKSRAIPSAEDNLKPIHRKILYTLYEDKVTPDKPTKKCATEAGRALAYSPHGDASVYGAMVRMSQWWKLRYPLIEMQGNCGNILGDGAAASRYTECRLSPIGMLMLEDLNKNCVDFKPNYDATTEEPVTLPSKFPYLLCGNNSGIAVGLSSDLVSHNFTEVMEATKYYMENRNCSVNDLMRFIKGPDFPTGGEIINGEELLSIYTTGRGSVKVRAHYDVSKKGVETLITFHDLPYGVEIDSGVKAPLKKLVIEDGYDVFKDINVEKVGPHNFDITITLRKDANVAQCLDLLLTKTRLQETIKVNNTVIINGEPKQLNLKEMIEYWINYRSNCIKRIAQTDYDKTNHKLTVTIGLQKCMSDIDKLVNIVRNADNRAAAAKALKEAFELNDEQADAVLEMKLARLNRLDLTELNKEEADLEKQLAALKKTIEDENERFKVILADLAAIKKVIGKDDRLTDITYNRPVEDVAATAVAVKKEFRIYDDGLHYSFDGTDEIGSNIVDIVYAYNDSDIIGYHADGTISPINCGFTGKILGATEKDKNKNKLVVVTKNGNVKVSSVNEFRLTKANEKALKLKDDDALVYAAFCNDSQYLMLFDGEQHILKLPIKDLTVAGKLTVGVKSGFAQIAAATVVSDSDLLLFVTKDLKGKYTSVKDFSADTKGNKGQMVTEGTIIMKRFDSARENIYLIPKQGKGFTISKDKLTVKSRTAVGAALSNRNILKIC